MANDLQNNSNNGSDWKTVWTKKLDVLKSTIGALPSYTGSGSQVLRRYDRTTSMDNLDNALQKYISDHNAADQALIYLWAAPYNGLAWFSLFLAFFLDISAFVTGFVLDIVDQRQTRRIFRNDLCIETSDTEQFISNAQDDLLSAPPTAQRYVYLTGDFTREGEQYYYQAYEGSEQVELEIPQKMLQPGFYVEVAKQFHPVTSQELAMFQAPDGPRDGIYQNCYLQYFDHILCIKNDKKEEYRYLATIEDDILVYLICKNECSFIDVRDIPPQIFTNAILALNDQGTQIAVLYLEQSNSTLSNA